MDAVGQVTEFMSENRRNQVARIVSEAGQRLLRFIRSRVPSEADAEDILQEVWQQLLSRPADDSIEQVGAWLYRVARNRIIDRYRRPTMASLDALTTETELDAETFELPDALLRHEATPESEHLRNRFWHELYAALADLPKEQRQVFVWHELEGLAFQEIAALTGENLNTLLSRKRYAVLHLRERLKRLHDEFLP